MLEQDRTMKEIMRKHPQVGLKLKFLSLMAQIQRLREPQKIGKELKRLYNAVVKCHDMRKDKQIRERLGKCVTRFLESFCAEIGQTH